ncbi:hypothetical protein hrd7_05680 [Leptolinea sp. HRD-7]|nr:hypothetical protein hrd7_05680 [Leptolinea sp. HRD-7]
MEIIFSKPDNIDSWLRLAAEVEAIFGPMVDVPEFRAGLIQAMQENRALGAISDGTLVGGIIFDTDTNEILWLVVSNAARGKGIGRCLIGEAINHLDSNRPIRVQTYDSTIEIGAAARALYSEFGFRDLRDGGLNPAGLPTRIMERSISGK